LEDSVDIFNVEFVVTEFGPLFGLRVGRTMNRLGDYAKTFFDVVPVGDADGAGKQLRGGVPNPGSTVTQNGAPRGPIKTPARGFSQDPFGELRTFGTGVRGGGAFAGGGGGNRALVTDGHALLIPRFGAPDRAQLHFTSLGGAILLFATASFQLLRAYRNSGSVQTQIQRGRYLAGRDRIHVASFVFGHFGAQRLGLTFDLLRVPDKQAGHLTRFRRLFVADKALDQGREGISRLSELT